MIRKLFVWAISLYALTLGGVILQTASFENQDFDMLAPVDVIVCLGSGMDPDGRLHNATQARVRTCTELYLAGAAPVVHFTGGRAVPDGPSAAEQMAAMAIELGLPASAATLENASQSTLQNALFSQPMLENAQSLRLVTEAFHLPRSAASFKLMGDHALSLTMSEPVRTTQNGDWDWRMLFREALAVWFNAGRFVVWWAAGIIGTEDRDALLY